MSIYIYVSYRICIYHIYIEGEVGIKGTHLKPPAQGEQKGKGPSLSPGSPNPGYYEASLHDNAALPGYDPKGIYRAPSKEYIGFL